MIKKTIIFSRHGLRYPLFYRDDVNEIYGKDIVDWNFPDEYMGLLSQKGEVIEYIFGQKLRTKIKNNISNPRIICNSTRRTYQTANVLKTAIFPYNSAIKINYEYKDFSKLDINYNIIFNDKKNICNEKCEEIDKKLYPVYKMMEEKLGLEKGIISNKKTYLDIDDTGYLYIKGALRLATDICDMFILKYYEGFQEDKIFKSNEFIKDLKFMSKAKDEFLDLIFATSSHIKASEKNVYKLLLKEIQNENDFTLIVGHDSNIATIFSSMGINYNLTENMLEKYPIGAKIIIEISEDDTYELKYAYFHYEDIRKIGLNNPIIETLKKGHLKELTK